MYNNFSTLAVYYLISKCLCTRYFKFCHIRAKMGRSILHGLSTFLIVFAIVEFSSAQQNAASSVAPALRECYNTPELFATSRRLPSSVNVLLDLIRKAENGRTTQDARQLAIELLHRFRQDGIVRSGSSSNPELTLPFTPAGRQTYRNRLLLTRLIPGTAVLFPNNTLNALERCSLHFMLSNSINSTVRGDEANVCNRLGRYERRIRSVGDDVEVFKDPLYMALKGNIEEEPEDELPPENAEDMPEEEIQEEEEAPEGEALGEDGDVEVNPEDPTHRSSQTNPVLSSCPVEGGVIHTRWGAVQAGTVIAGIASGLEPQNIPQDNYTIDSRFAATLSGDLAEAALWQAPLPSRSIGAAGGWTNTQVPRLYYVSTNQNLEMTDADIRGGLDGLIMAMNVAAWRQSFGTIKVSQILDMYYSPRGVFSPNIRACNRNNMLTEVAPSETLLTQTTGFSIQFDERATLPATVTAEGIPRLAREVVDALYPYVSNLNDLNCAADTMNRNRIATDIIIVVDSAWRFDIVHSAITHLLDNLDVNQYGSNFTIIGGFEGALVINSSNSISDFHQMYNLSVHSDLATGFQFSRMFTEVEQIIRNRMDQDRVENNVGGKSMIVLFMPFQAPISEEDRAFARERLAIHRSYIPDLRVLVLGGLNREAYEGLVTNHQTDAFNMQDSLDGTNIVSSVNPVINRISEIPRRLANPICGSNFEGGSHTASFDDFVEPETVNYYRISPNYFFGEGNRNLRVRGHGYGTVTVCTSRIDSFVTQNSTAEDMDCRNVASSNEETFSMSGFCVDGFISECRPFFVSAQSSGLNTIRRCTDQGCRFPDNIKLTFTLENFGCASGGTKLFASFALIVTVLAFLKL